MKQTKITNSDLKQLYDYFSKQKTYMWDELGQTSSDMLKKSYDKNAEYIKNIENIQKTLNELEEDSLWLSCLEGAGVYNWQGYDYAVEMLEEIKSEE